MRSSAQLKDGHLRSLMHAPHPDDMHEPSGFFQAVGFENDVPYPEWGSKILVGHLCSSGIVAPNGELERPRRNKESAMCVQNTNGAHSAPFLHSRSFR